MERKGARASQNAVSKMVQDFFEGREWRDAPANLPFTLRILPEDWLDAVRGDPANCLLACSYRRQVGGRGVLFYRSVAYVDMGDEIFRYVLPAETMRVIERFDTEGTFQADTRFVRMIPPSPGKRLRGKPKKKRSIKRTPRAVRSAQPRALVRGTAAYQQRMKEGG